MARTEKVIMTNMCMVFSENRVLVQDRGDHALLWNNISGRTCGRENHLQML